MMMKKSFAFRKSSLKERKEFYEKEFSISKINNWFRKNKLRLPQLCALDAGTESKIIVDKKLKNQMLYFPFSELKEKILQYLPEDIYYDRNVYKNPEKALEELKFDDWKKQELAFDIDMDNIKCKCKNKSKVCERCLEIAYKSSINLKEKLKEFGFKNFEIIYSGRGFHVHVLDKSAFGLNAKYRRELNKKLSKFPIDAWVSAGNIRLIRMPYTLHGLVSRIVLPISIKSKLNFTKTIPKFLKN